MQEIFREFNSRVFALIANIYNSFILYKSNRTELPCDLKELNDIRERSVKDTDISDHLLTLFVESLSVKPKLIVEIGVRGGESTFVLERVAKLSHSKLVSVDIVDCSDVSSYESWTFVKKDDIEFASEFETWCIRNDINQKIDVLFIDTSHLFEHTLHEINSWLPLMSDNSVAFFHDTNSRKVCFRKDGRIYPKINKGNGRDVIRALEVYFKTSFSERIEFIDYRNGWLIKHYPYCYGLTILKKIS